MKKAFISAITVALALCVFIAFPVYSEDVITDDSEFLSLEYYAPQSSEDIFESYFDADELEARIREAVMNYESSLNISSYKIPASMLSELYVFFSDSVTDCFHVNLKGCAKNSRTDLLVSMSFEYLVEEDDYDEYKAMWDAGIESYLEGIDDDLTDVQKALVLHDRIILRCDYDLNNSGVGKESYTPFGVVINQSAVCQGYSELYAYLLKCVGIESYLCSSTTLNHIWNILVIDGEYYYVDVTWDDPVWDVSGRVMHTNFLCSYDVFKETHDADDYDTTPSSTRFDEYFWRDCRSSFALVEDEIYYVDFTEQRIETYNGNPVWDVSTYWMVNEEGYYWPGCFTYLVAYDDFLFFNMPDSIHVYDPIAKAATKVLTPTNPFSTSESTYNIFGFREKDGKFLLEFNDTPYFSENTKEKYSLVVDIDPEWIKKEDTVVSVTGVTLDKTEATLTEGDMLSLLATVTPEDATDKTVTWTSSDDEVASVADGVVTANKPGTATITATAGGKTAECAITVEAKVIPVTGVSLNKTEATLTEGDMLFLLATVTPEDATDKTVTWASSDDEVASVANGVVTANKPGTATITATAGGKTAECAVTVKAKVIPVTGVSLDKTEATLTEGDTLALAATVTPEDATNKNVTWKSSDEEVAVVENGVVTAKKAGTATITVTTVDGNKTASCSVAVKAPTKAYIYTEAPKSAVQGSKFSYKIYLAGTYGGYSFVIPNQIGLTVTDIKAAEADINADKLDDGTWKISVIPSCAKVDSEKTEIAEVTVSVAKDAELGDKVLSMKNVFITDDHGDMVSIIEDNYGSIKITDQVPGDINGDGKFNYADVSKLYAVYRKKATVSEYTNTDINGDGAFNYLDVSKLYAIYRNKAKFI